MENLIEKIDAYCAENNISRWQFGEKYFGTRHLYDRIKSGRVNMQTLRRVENIVSPQPKPKKRTARKK